MKSNFIFNSDDNDELNEILKKSRYGRDDDIEESCRPKPCYTDSPEPPASPLRTNGKVVQWSTSDDTVFIPTRKTVDILLPGYYEIGSNPHIGIYFEKLPIVDQNIINFPHTNTDTILNEIAMFWDRESTFREFKLTYSRGILLWGPAGSGKSCTLQLIAKDVIQRKGIVVKFNVPALFSNGMRLLREIQPNSPVVVLMEDIDSIIRTHSETEVINILDGVDKLDKVVYLATTNYPELLGQRIINRPSRFDKRFKIGFPTESSREIYFRHLIQDRDLNIDIPRWVEDTKGFTFAHLRELFVAVVILENDYDTALNTLKSMKSVVSSENDANETLGFRSKLYEEIKNGKHPAYIP